MLGNNRAVFKVREEKDRGIVRHKLFQLSSHESEHIICVQTLDIGSGELKC
jgi:hypothetical protein